MDFRSLPDRADHPRYTRRLRDIEHLLRQKKERLVEEGMLKDRATAADDFWWFCRRFTSFQTYKIDDEPGHPRFGSLWIDHPFCFWLARTYQEVLIEPQEGWVWIKTHRLSFKTTFAVALCLWIHSVDESTGTYPRTLGLSRTIGLWTHKLEQIGAGMSRGLLGMLQTDRLRDHFPQFRNLQEGTKQGYVVDRPPGPRDQSLHIQSIAASPESVHPDIYILDDVITGKLRGNVEQIAKIAKNISDVAALMTPSAPVIVINTPKDKADPLVAREADGLFSRVISQAATSGGDFTPRGQANLHTAKHYARQRQQVNDDSIYFPEFELEFRERAGTLFSWSWIKEYDQSPEELAASSPFINIIVDGASGKRRSDFTVIRVITWTAHNAWANLELIRERVGASKAMQILLGRDRSDPTTEWIERGAPGWRAYTPGCVGLVEKWMQYDSKLCIWFDDTADWRATFAEHVRLRRITFGGRMPTVRAWPQPKIMRTGTQKAKREGFTKSSKIADLEPAYQQGRAAYPRHGFGHGSYNGLSGGPDQRDTKKQFREDEFERKEVGKDLPFDDMLDTEALLVLPQAFSQMRRPAEGSGIQIGGVVFPVPTVNNPFGLPGGGAMMPGMMPGKTWVSIL